MADQIVKDVRSLAARISPALRQLVAAGKEKPPLITFTQEPAGETRLPGPEGSCLLPAALLETSPDPVAALMDFFNSSEGAQAADSRVFQWTGVGTFHVQPLSPTAGRLDGKIAIVTGAAQGFGRGIAGDLAAHGAVVVLADLNYAAACRAAEEINSAVGAGRALALSADVGSETSVSSMAQETVLAFGGIDLLVSNAGILRAGGLEEMSLADFELVTHVNYTAFFLCAKYASVPMKTAARIRPDVFSDIIQINSKSGLQGSNKNFAYAGGKFGGIGLVQSFAMELAPHRVKVNAICPGNYFEGPLWSDPENGLFVQYLKAGKVPGANTVQDVFESYASKVPLGRGCRPADVSRAICYLVEQEYETGQALPVTGGQVMLH